MSDQVNADQEEDIVPAVNDSAKSESFEGLFKKIIDALVQSADKLRQLFSSVVKSVSSFFSDCYNSYHFAKQSAPVEPVKSPLPSDAGPSDTPESEADNKNVETALSRPKA